jgi:hypothetical protein
MNNSSFDINTLISEFSPPSSIVADIEILCQNLEKMFAGQPANLALFAAGLARVMEWAAIRTHAEDSSAAVAWRARYAGLAKLGGTLTCQNDKQELMLSMDSVNVVYMGSWRSLQPGQEKQGGVFSIEDSPSGRILVLDTGLAKQNFQMPASEGLTWGTVAGFLQGIQVEKLSQPEPPESQPAPASPVHLARSNVTDAELSLDVPPTILARPTKHQNASMPLPSENSRRKPAPGEPPAMINPEIWQCACGSKNAEQFCPKCGSEAPVSVAVKKSAPVQPMVCGQCGGALSIGARFCRNCGIEARG